MIMITNDNVDASSNQSVKDGLYTLKNVSSGYMLNVYAGKDINGTKVTTWEYDGTTDQRIYIEHKGNGKYLLRFNASSGGRVVDVNRGESLTASIDDGDKIDIWTDNDLEAQYFYINPQENGGYTFELVSKPNHVISAISSSAATSNGTQLQLKYYSGENYQKWYICNTSGSVINVCNHLNTTESVSGTNYEKYNDDRHRATTEYSVICNDCKEVVKNGQTKSFIEKHKLNKTKCTLCNYLIKEEKCAHSQSYEDVLSYEIAQKDDNYHTVSDTYNEYCSECGEVLKLNASKNYDEKHTLVNDKCDKCSYTVPGSEATQCKHKNTIEHVIENTDSYVIKNENLHTVSRKYNLFCADCYTYIDKNLTESYDEEHIIENNKCKYCGYAKPVKEMTVSDGLYNIKNVSSGYLMNVFAGKDSNGTKVTMWENDYSDDQKIYIAHQGNGQYLLKYNASSGGRVIDINRGNSMTASIDVGDKIDIWTANDPEAQLFYINDCGNGKFTFELVAKPGHIISPSNNSEAGINGSQLELKTDENSDYQKWYIDKPSVLENTVVSGSSIKDKFRNIANNIGWQTRKNYSNWDWMCGCYATAYIHSYLSGSIHQPSEYWTSSSDATTHWYRAGGTRIVKSNNSQVLTEVKNQLNNGKPCIIRVNSSYGGHYVAVISYTGNGNKTSDFTVIDPWDGNFKSLSNYTIHNTNKQVIYFK